MADEKKTFDPDEEIKAGEELSLDDLLSRLRDEHGVDFGKKESADARSKKKENDLENELDGLEFDNRPIEADYTNYNIIGRVSPAEDSDVSELASDEAESLEEDSALDEEAESLPWDDDEVKESPKQEDAIYHSMRERYLRQRGLWQEEKNDDFLVEDELSASPLEPSVESEDIHIYNKEENLRENPVDSLSESVSDFDSEAIERVEAVDFAEKIEVVEEFEAAEKIETVEENEALDEIEAVEEIELPEEIGTAEEIKEPDEPDELEVLDELEDLDELEELGELEGYDETGVSVSDDAITEMGASDETEVLDNLEAFLDDVDLDEAEFSDEDVDETFDGEEDPDLLEFAEILKGANATLDESASDYSLSDALGMTSRASYIKPKERRKASSTPIEDEAFEKPAFENAILPSRKNHKEYTDYGQNKYIKKSYQSKLRAEGIRCIGLVILTLIAFLVESLHLFGITALHPSMNPTLAVAVSAMLMLVACAFTIWEYVDGAILLFRGTPVPESLMLPATMIPLLYYIVALLSGSRSLTLFGFAFCVCALICKLQTIFRIMREARTFAVVSREKPKRTLSALNRENAMPEADVFAAYLSPEANYHCVKRTLFVDDYFKMTNKVAKNKKMLSLFLIASSAIALLVFAFAYIRTGLFTSAFTYAMTSFFYTFPFSCFFLYEIPLLWASFSAFEDNAAIVGEAAIETFAEEGAVSFADTDLFPPSDISLANILLFRETEMEKMLKYTALVFDEIHSSVSTVIMRSIPGYKLNDEIRIANIYDDGIEAYINSEQVLVGSYEFVKRFGASLPARYVHKKNGFAQMFTVVSGETLGKYDVDYVLDPEIPDALTHIAESGFYTAIRTLDPNLTPEFLSEKLDYKNYPLKLIKVHDDRELLRMRKKVSASIVTTEKTKSLMKALVLCDKSSFAQTMGMIFAAAGVLTGVGIVVVSILLNNTAFISGRAIALFQLFWLLPIFFVSMLYVKNKSGKDEKKGFTIFKK